MAVIGLTAGAYLARAALVAHQTCQSVRSYEKSVGAVQTIGSGPERITVIGDSYATGDTLKDRGDAWVDDLATQQNATVSVLAQGGTGYTNAGFCGDSTYDTRVADVAATRPDLVIVEGGLNDTDTSPSDERAAAERVYRSLRHYDVAVVGPVDVPAVEGERRVDDALKRATRAQGATYVSALDWHIDLGPDEKHPSPSGHAAFATNLATSLGL
ncbi:SGNH/GDSL hydrolase family protein [Curtobacterium sp. VKM Ac-2884]|uniref:SGNH/GDSL hydrolase family protein n=1 Tax=Curtobacterium sp. VKM Ac-2884 TaxID=2783818 RepID=UPI001889D2C8|nr:SGNH/GDSL hydrolase family protein [Curtobacterium sp. VKM Ac-2884]MBF4603776.1 SGNH/GDSL hydrolase family protein [Curtobacterium sp. VKM Ac-2884]